MTASSTDITELPVYRRKGDQRALDKLIPPVHDELRLLAHLYLRRERPDPMSQSKALVQEIYLRLAGEKNASGKNPPQFFVATPQLMRHLLADYDC